MAEVFIIVILFLLIITGVVALQIFLSRKNNKWSGLILPLISLAVSILIVINLIGFTAYTSLEVISENGEVIEQVETIEESPSEIILPAIFIFLLSNIPTIILVGIYFGCREKLKRDKEIEKMNIQDLE